MSSIANFVNKNLDYMLVLCCVVLLICIVLYYIVYRDNSSSTTVENKKNRENREYILPILITFFIITGILLLLYYRKYRMRNLEIDFSEPIDIEELYSDSDSDYNRNNEVLERAIRLSELKSDSCYDSCSDSCSDSEMINFDNFSDFGDTPP